MRGGIVTRASAYAHGVSRPSVHAGFTRVVSNLSMRRARDTVMLLGLLTLGVAALVFGGSTLLNRQAALARARIGKPLGEESLDADRVWRRRLSGEPIRLLLLGDSLAAGLGAEHRKETLGGRIAKGLARQSGRPVHLRTAAVVGAESHALAQQLDSLPARYRADVAVIVVGGNDVTHLISPKSATQHLRLAIERLRGEGTAVVVGTCPDLGALQPVPQPLRLLLSRMSSRMASAQTRTARRAGATPVSLRRAVGPSFRADPGEMFSLDQFHPSAAGYRRTAEALVPAVVQALRQPALPGPGCSGTNENAASTSEAGTSNNESGVQLGLRSRSTSTARIPSGISV